MMGETVRISSNPGDDRSLDKARETVAAKRAGTPIIAHGVLWNPHNQTYGTPDLLVRSDVLARLFPRDVNYMEAHLGAPALELENAHYCVVDVRFRTLELLAD